MCSGSAGSAPMPWQRWASRSRCWRWCLPSASACRCRPRPWWRGALEKKTPRMRRLPECRSIVAGARHFAGAGDSCGDLCAGSAARDGRFAGDRGQRVRLCADCAGRLRRDHHALPQQRDLSRSGRCRDCDAAAVGVEHHQPGTRSLPHLRHRAVSADGRDGRGAGDLYGALDRRAVPVLPAAQGHGTDSRSGAPSAPECCA